MALIVVLFIYFVYVCWFYCKHYFVFVGVWPITSICGLVWCIAIHFTLCLGLVCGQSLQCMSWFGVRPITSLCVLVWCMASHFTLCLCVWPITSICVLVWCVAIHVTLCLGLVCGQSLPFVAWSNQRDTRWVNMTQDTNSDNRIRMFIYHRSQWLISLTFVMSVTE